MAELKYEVVSFDGDPQQVLETKLTPHALRRLSEQLDSDDERVRANAIDKVLKADRRFQPASPTTQVAVMNFNPEHLAGALGGIKEMLGGGVAKAKIQGPAGEAVDGGGVAG